jgi:hypothetical protein
MTLSPYPRELKLLLKKCRYDKGLTMVEALEKVYAKFPEVRERLTVVKAYSVLANFIRNEEDGEQEPQEEEETGDPIPWTELPQPGKVTVFTRALALRGDKYRWSAVVEQLQEEFRLYAIPTPSNLARLTGHWAETNEILAPAETTKVATASCLLTITNGGTTQFTKKLTKGQAKQLTAQLWE